MTRWMSVVPPGWMGDDAGAAVGLHVAFGGAQLGVVSQPGRAEDVQHGLSHAQARGLAHVGCLRPLVGDVGAAVAHPVVAQVQQPHDLGLNVHVDEAVAHVGVIGHRLAAALGGAAVLEQPVNQPVAPDAPAGAVLQLQVGGGDLPALVFAADQV